MEVQHAQLKAERARLRYEAMGAAQEPETMVPDDEATVPGASPSILDVVFRGVGARKRRLPCIRKWHSSAVYHSSTQPLKSWKVPPQPCCCCQVAEALGSILATAGQVGCPSFGSQLEG